MNDRWKVPLAVLSVVGLASAMAVLLIHISPVAAQDSCTGVQVNAGDDLDYIVNSDRRDTPTTFCVNAKPDGAPLRGLGDAASQGWRQADRRAGRDRDHT